jgi:hypothetical protein
MLMQYDVAIVCDSNGDATVYAGLNIRGSIHAIKYVAGTLAATADLVITGETTGVAILTDSPSASEWYYPRAMVNKVSDGAAATDSFADVRVLNERIKIVVVQGGAAGAGTISIFVDERA